MQAIQEIWQRYIYREKSGKKRFKNKETTINKESGAMIIQRFIESK